MEPDDHPLGPERDFDSLPGEPVEPLFCVECDRHTAQRKSVAGTVTGFLCLVCSTVEMWRKTDEGWIVTTRKQKPHAA